MRTNTRWKRRTDVERRNRATIVERRRKSRTLGAMGTSRFIAAVSKGSKSYFDSPGIRLNDARGLEIATREWISSQVKPDLRAEFLARLEERRLREERIRTIYPRGEATLCNKTGAALTFGDIVALDLTELDASYSYVSVVQAGVGAEHLCIVREPAASGEPVKVLIYC